MQEPHKSHDAAFMHQQQQQQKPLQGQQQQQAGHNQKSFVALELLQQLSQQPPSCHADSFPSSSSGSPEGSALVSQVLTLTCVVLLHSGFTFNWQGTLHEEGCCMISMGMRPRSNWQQAARDVRLQPVLDQQSLCPGCVILFSPQLCKSCIGRHCIVHVHACCILCIVQFKPKAETSIAAPFDCMCAGEAT